MVHLFVRTRITLYDIFCKVHDWWVWGTISKLGHTGARALATSGYATPMQWIYITNSIDLNRKSALKMHKRVEIEQLLEYTQCNIAICILRVTRSVRWSHWCKFAIWYYTMHTSTLKAWSESTEVSKRPDLILNSCRLAWPLCYNLVLKVVRS